MSAIGRSGGRWRGIRRAVLERDGYRYQRCGRAAGANNLEVHHIRPRHAGGTDAPSNLRTLCVTCHLAVTKREKNPARAEWEAYLGA